MQKTPRIMAFSRRAAWGVLLAFGGVLAGPARAAPYPSLPSADRITADISTLGVRKVLRDQLLPDRAIYDALLAQIATGESAWLRIADAFYPVADTGTREGLSAALSRALPMRSEQVLALLSLAEIDSSFTVSDVCSARFAFHERPVAAQRWQAETARALADVRVEELETVRAACIAALPSAQ